MQTLHLWFRALRAISPGQSPSRWQTPSMRSASKCKGALPLPNLPKPTSAVGAHPETSHQRLDRCPTLGAGLTMGSKFREPRVGGAVAPDTRLVCWSQTVGNNPRPAAHHKAGQGVGCSLQAPFSEVRWTPSTGLSFSLRPQRCGARACGEKMADPVANVGALAEVSIGADRRCERALRHRLRRGAR